MSHKISAKEAKYFKQKVLYWQNFFGLKDWLIAAYPSPLKGISGAAKMWPENRGAHIMINETLPHQPTMEWINRLALHEVCHVMLADMRFAGTKKEMNKAEHSVIRRLENALAKLKGGK